MAPAPQKGTFGRVAITAAAVVIVLAGLKAASAVIVPFLLAGFIALLCSIPLFWLYRKGVPNVVAVLLVVAALVGVGSVLGITVGSSLRSFTSQLPVYRQGLQDQMVGTLAWASEQGIDVSMYKDSITDLFDPSSAMSMAGTALKGASSMLTNGFMILLTVVFILLEAVAMPRKLTRVLDNPEATFAGFREFSDSVKRYLLIKTSISAVTGILVTIWLSVLGLDYPVLWGLVAFAFNFVPTIGSIIAAVPPLLLAAVQLGPGAMVSVGVCFLTVNIVMGSVVEPRIMGEGLGLSTLVVFLSLVFWGWLLGPVGMLLSVPLTMIVKIACQSADSLKHVGVLLGPPDGGGDKEKESPPTAPNADKESKSKGTEPPVDADES